MAWVSDWDYLQSPDEIIVDNTAAVFTGDWTLSSRRILWGQLSVAYIRGWNKHCNLDAGNAGEWAIQGLCSLDFWSKQGKLRITLTLYPFSLQAATKETASVSGLIEETANFALRGSKLKCEYSIPDNLWLLEIDKGQISQVIHNLIINADHAMPNGGIIRIDVKNVTIGKHDILPLEEGKYLKISVKDKGVGIPKDYLPKVFDPYFTTKENGSGLGLATCFSIIKKHRGHITVESEQGNGTTFHIYLPASEKELFEVKEIKEERSYLGHEKISISTKLS